MFWFLLIGFGEQHMPGLGKNYCPLGKVGTALLGRSIMERENGNREEKRFKATALPFEPANLDPQLR